MIDTSTIHVDLLALIGADVQLKHKAATNGGEWAGPCPWCGGTDRFLVWPNADRPGYHCRRCGRTGDAIRYLMETRNIDFPEAAHRLGAVEQDGNAATGRRGERQPPERPAPSIQAPSAAWQARARAFAHYARTALWSRAGERYLAYLREKRGLKDETIHDWGLGCNPTELWDLPARWGMPSGGKIWCARGLVIPCQIAGVTWYVKVRRPREGDELAAYVGASQPLKGGKGPKYVAPRGSETVALFGAEWFKGRGALLLVEGELDAILAWQEAGDLVDVATLGSSGNPLAGPWLPHLLPYPRWLLCYDLDEAGTKGAAKLAHMARTVRIRPPLAEGEGNDLTDMWRAGGDVRAWLSLCLMTGSKREDGSGDGAPAGALPGTDSPAPTSEDDWEEGVL